MGRGMAFFSRYPHKTQIYLKIDVSYVIILALAAVIILQRCGNSRPPEAPKRDTVVVTQLIPQPPVQLPTTQPNITITTPGQPPAQYTQLSTDVRELSRQVQELAQKHYAVNTYRDSVVLRDTAGQRVGVVNLSDVVSENQIKQRSPSYQLAFPVTTRTITVTTPPLRARQVYAGFGVNGSPVSLVNSVDAGLLYKDRKERIFTGKIGITLDGKPFAGVGSYWKINFKKN